MSIIFFCDMVMPLTIVTVKKSKPIHEGGSQRPNSGVGLTFLKMFYDKMHNMWF